MLNRDGKEVKTGTRALAVENDFYTLTCQTGKRIRPWRTPQLVSTRRLKRPKLCPVSTS